MDDQGILQEFREEARDHLEILESTLLSMERDGACTETFHRIFRSAHTIKGASGFLGLTGIGAVSHAMETVLALLRDDKIEFGPGLAAVLLGAVDVLRRLLDLAPAEDGLDVSPVVAQLEGLIDPPTAASVLDEEEQIHHLGAARSMATSTLHLRQIPANHRFLYILSYAFDDLLARQKKGRSPVALFREIQNLGLLVDDRIPDHLEDPRGVDTPALLILFSTDLEPGHMAMATQLAPSQIELLDLDEVRKSVGLDPPAPGADAAARTAPARVAKRPRQASPVPPAPDPAATARLATETVTDSVRVRIDVLDRLMRLAGELVLVRNRQLCRGEGQGLGDREIVQRLDQVTAGIQETVLSARMQPLGNVLSKFQRIVRDLGHRLGKEIELRTEGGETELDRTLLEAISDPLTHIVRNCCDHGIESPADRARAGKPTTGTVAVKAWHEAGRVHIRITDDGKGIDAARVRAKALEKGLRTEDELARMSDREARRLVFLPGFSTAETVSDISGRGVGMDVVIHSIEKLGGFVSLESETGAGTTLDLQLPLTLAIVPALVVESAGMRLAIPQASVEELVRLYDEDVGRIESAGHENLFRLREHLLPLVDLEQILSHREPWSLEERHAFCESSKSSRQGLLEAYRSGRASGISETFAVLKSGRGRYGLVLARILGTEEIVVEPLHPGLGSPAIYAGVTVLGDGEIALILDTQGICRHAGIQPVDIETTRAEGSRSEASSMLLFRSGPDEQIGLPLGSLRRVVRLRPGQIERSGTREYAQIEDHSVRIERLESVLSVSAGAGDQEGYLLLPSGEDRSWGILATSLVDSGEYRFQLEPCPEEGPLVRGTALLRGRRTLLLDDSRLRGEFSR